MSWVATLCRGGDGRRLLVSEENGTTGPQQCTDESCTVVFEGRLHTGAGDPAASVLQAYLRDGEEALKHLQGWFTLVVWDARVQRLFAVRDPLGVQPLFYATGDDEFRVAPMLERLLSNSRAPEPNVQAMAAHVLGRSYPSDQTLCDGISRLPPGHILSWTSGDVRVERHWQPVWDEPTVTDDQAAERLDHVLRQAVARSIGPGRPGVFLSGGLDSALVASVTADVCRTHGLPSPLMLSALFTGTEADESSTQREVARGLGLEQLALTAEEAVENGAVLGAAIELAAEAAGPPELLQPIYDRLAVAARQKGVTVVLNGAGGDELLMPPPAFARERFRALDAPALLQLGRAFLGYWPEATPRSVAHSLLIRSGFRPLLVGGVTKALTLIAPARLHSVRTARASRSIPDWLLPGDSLRVGQLEQSRTERPFFDDITLSYVQEDGYDTTSRLGVRSFAPLLEPDVVALLLNIAPRRLVAQGEAKRLARELLAPRLPQLTASWPRTVYANGLWQRALRREGVATWVALGGTPHLAGLGLVDPAILRARIQSGQAASDPREAVQVCRALILEMWIASRILRRSS